MLYYQKQQTPGSEGAIMEEINQEDLEHGEDHPVTTEIPEFDEEWIKKLYQKLHKSAVTTERYIQQQSELWGIADEQK